MKKNEELASPTSCLNKAEEDEMVFVLLERDAAAPDAIRAWIESRIKRGLNQPLDEQLVKAEKVAQYMEEHR